MIEFVANLRRLQFILKDSHYCQHTSNPTYREKVTIGGKEARTGEIEQLDWQVDGDGAGGHK